MARLLAPLAVVLVAAAPLLAPGSADLTFDIASGDTRSQVRIGPEADSEARVEVHQIPDGTAYLTVSVRADTEADGIAYRAFAEVSAQALSGRLEEGDLVGLASRSTAGLDTNGAVVRTSRRVRATDVQVRISRLTDTEVHGAFVITSDRDDEIRVSAQFVALRPADV